ncbi:MAG: low molecular weight protein-tyrosine-phosphatase [Solirubrobacterales bacterium]
MLALVHEAGLTDTIEIESAGTGSWHVGSPPDARASAAARSRGIALEGAARQVREEDLEDFDLIVAMDRSNVRELRALARGEEERAKVRLLREFDPAAAGVVDLDVPDPYYGAPGGFDEVLDLVQAACRGLLDQLCEGERA